MLAGAEVSAAAGTVAPVADPSGWTVEFYADRSGREPCREWADGLSPQKRAAFTAAVTLVLARRGLDVMETEYGKALGDGLYELRVRWTASETRHKIEGLPPGEVGGAAEAILLRVFFCTAGRRVILLLGGYDKARDPSTRRQQREIAKARKLITAYREVLKRSGKRD
jgi:putative component of toxin-antitoxin plasmid stabilization module